MRPRGIESKEEGIDRLLRRSMSAPTPSLAADFDQRVMREVRRRSRPLDLYGRIFLTGYGVISLVVSAVLMRGVGLDWSLITGATLTPIILALAARSGWRAIRAAGESRQ